MHGWRVCVLAVRLLIVGFVRFSLRFMLSMASILLFVFCMSVLFHSLSQRCVGGSYALRVSPAVTRLTVYRRPQVRPGRKLGNGRAKLFVANGVFK